MLETMSVLFSVLRVITNSLSSVSERKDTEVSKTVMREANMAALQILTGDHNQVHDREDSIRAAIS